MAERHNQVMSEDEDDIEVPDEFSDGAFDEGRLNAKYIMFNLFQNILN